jgi:hypothetical protein
LACYGKGTLDFDEGNEIVATEILFSLRYMFNSLQMSRIPESGPWRLSSRLSLLVNVVGALLLVTAPFWLFELFAIYDEEMSISLFAAAFTVALIISFNYFLILHCTRRHPSLRRLMAVGMLAKMAAAGLYITMVVRLYNYSADMAHYFYAAQGLATTYGQTGILTVPDPLWGLNFPPFLAQCVFVVTGISLPVAMVIFASMSFWGLYFIYRAFCIGFLDATRFDMVAILAFLLPSCVFWTASISKDAVVMLGAGIATYGFARMHHRVGLQGYVLLASGLAVIMTVRPHMAGIMAVAFIFPYVFGANRIGLGGLALKAVGIPALVALSWFFVSQAETYVEMQDFSQGTSVVIQVAKDNSGMGGSTYGDSLSSRMAMAPFLLFRPFPFEVHNFQAALASLEGLLLLLMFVRQRKVLYQTLGQIRSNPFAMFLALFAVEFTIVYAGATTNFGLLNRQRVMLLPFAVMLFFGDSRAARNVASVSVRAGALRHRFLVANGGRLRGPVRQP